MAFLFYNKFGDFMEIIVGKYSGFCSGVNYTVTKAMKVLENNGYIYSLGDIVHNERVIDNLKNSGLVVKNDIDDIPHGSKVIIRAHGEKLSTYEKARQKQLDIIDLTCCKVKSIHNKIIKNKDTSFIIIIGKKNHPETIAHTSFSNNSFVVENSSDINDAYKKYLYNESKKVYVVVQTTFNEDLFNELVRKIKLIFINTPIIVDNTICYTTAIRQQEVVDISKKVDKMIIIGGKNSSNTKELAVIAKKYCNDVYLIQDYHDLETVSFGNDDVVGIEAGASTPSIVIDEVVSHLGSIYKIKK